MEKFYDGIDFDMSSLAVRYGQYDGTIDYKKIAELEETERNKTIDKLVAICYNILPLKVGLFKCVYAPPAIASLK